MLRPGAPAALISPQDTPVVLLHGAKFSSATWDKRGTVKAIVDQGFDVYAIDLPGYGRSKGRVDVAVRPVFLKALIQKLELNKPVVVAPSMSGAFAVPMVADKVPLPLLAARAFRSRAHPNTQFSSSLA